MGLEQIIPAFFLIAVLILVLPSFIRSNSNLKQLIKNLLGWSIIVVSVMIISPISKEINKLLVEKNFLDSILLDGSEKANKIASTKIKKIHEIVGF